MPAARTSRPPTASGTAVRPVVTFGSAPEPPERPERPADSAAPVAVGCGVQIGSEPVIHSGESDGAGVAPAPAPDPLGRAGPVATGELGTVAPATGALDAGTEAGGLGTG